MPRLMKPRALPPGGTVGLAAPAGPIDEARVAAGVALLEAAGFSVARRPDLTSRAGYLAGDDERRARELSGLFADPEVDAILCVRGGYGSPRILPRLDAAAVRKAAKPLVGYSDATALLLWQRRHAGLMGIHGPMLERGEELPPGDLAALLAMLQGTGPREVVLEGQPGVPGVAEGRLTGGSLALVAASLGTPWELDTRGAILLLEDTGERPFRIDRMLQSLAAAGHLTACAGVGIGSLESCVDPNYPEPDALSVMTEILKPLGKPLVTGLPFGHGRPNRPWPLGARGRLDGSQGTLTLLERAVRRRR